MMGSKDAYLSKINPNQSLQPGYWIFDRYQIVKRTTKRVYFCKTGKRIDEHGEPINFRGPRYFEDARLGFVDRQKLEANGEIFSHCWYGNIKLNLHFFTSMELIRERITEHDS